MNRQRRSKLADWKKKALLKRQSLSIFQFQPHTFSNIINDTHREKKHLQTNFKYTEKD